MSECPSELGALMSKRVSINMYYADGEQIAKK